MSILTLKSKENLDSAVLLIDNEYFNSSIHCSYYSSVQLMTNILFKEYSFSQTTLSEASKKELKGSHVYAINFLFEKMSKTERLKAVDFKRMIGILKNKREKADYHEELIDIEFSKQAYDEAIEVNSILEKIYIK